MTADPQLLPISPDLLLSGSVASALAFESKRMVLTRAANLDLEFVSSPPVAIESKFEEPYRDKPSFDFRPSYFGESNAVRWEQLPRCRQFAEGANPGYKHLKSSQLIKHLIGLTRCHGSPDSFHLVYLWFEVRGEDGKPHPESSVHQDEIDDFRTHLDPEVRFSSMTYQELYTGLKGLPGLDKEHLDYLGSRYFPGL